ncbi:Dual-specificity RNA methyltransferase [Nymphaea thermarum]|nr:Dual-specificity RNA methyltransferase [Nymphaea thermarum]
MAGLIGIGMAGATSSCLFLKTTKLLISPLKRASLSPFPPSIPLSSRCFSLPAMLDGGVGPVECEPVSLQSGIQTRMDVTHKGSKVILKGMEFPELERWVQSFGYRSGQALMLWKALYRDNSWAHGTDDLQGLNKDFRAMLSENAEFKTLSLKNIHISSDGTRKVLFLLEDGLTIETVVIPCSRGRTTVCVSSQGMGEPLHNIDNVIKAAAIMVDDQGLHFSPRKVTVSTSGLVPQIKRFLRESNCQLAVSLNATTDEVRNWIMPINRKYNLAQLLQTLKDELQHKHRFKVLFEYVMLAGVNDSIEDARRLITLVQGIPCKINLISFNPHSGSKFLPTSEERMIEFRNVLAAGGSVAFLRLSRGDDQMAACGQLGKPGGVQPPRLKPPARFQVAG